MDGEGEPMSRKIIIALLALSISCIMSGCTSRYPIISIDTAPFAAIQSIDIGEKYEFIDYDVARTATGKDLIIHFERRTDEQTDGR